MDDQEKLYNKGTYLLGNYIYSIKLQKYISTSFNIYRFFSGTGIEDHN